MAFNIVVLARSRLNRGQWLDKGQQLTSNNGNYRLIMQNDGNLVIYNTKNLIWEHPIWATNTVDRGNRFIMQRDGNAVLYDSSNRPLWASGTHGTSAVYIVMQDDGNLVIYDHRDDPRWASGTHG